jgi:hypothetical protein
VSPFVQCPSNNLSLQCSGHGVGHFDWEFIADHGHLIPIRIAPTLANAFVLMVGMD